MIFWTDLAVQESAESIVNAFTILYNLLWKTAFTFLNTLRTEGTISILTLYTRILFQFVAVLTLVTDCIFVFQRISFTVRYGSNIYITFSWNWVEGVFFTMLANVLIFWGFLTLETKLTIRTRLTYFSQREDNEK